MPVEIDPEPQHDIWHFKAVDQLNEDTDFIISTKHVRILIKYIADLKLWGQNGWSGVEYFNKQSELIEAMEE
jgi:hypothetical protein